jgi:hypothetical protein
MDVSIYIYALVHTVWYIELQNSFNIVDDLYKKYVCTLQHNNGLNLTNTAQTDLALYQDGIVHWLFNTAQCK